MRICKVCGSSDLSSYSYSNHLNKINLNYLKHFLANAMQLIVSHPKLEIKTLFSPLYKILRCNNCGYGVYDRSIDSQLLNIYYKSIYFQSGGIPKKAWKDKHTYLNNDRANGQYSFVKNYLMHLQNISILEVGAGSAFTLSRIRASHEGRIEINVVEPGEGWSSYYAANDIKLVANFFPFDSGRKYNYIHTSHWLEHVVDLDDTVQRLRDLLLDDGLLFIEVPNCTSEYYELDIGDTPHIHFFTKEALTTLLKKIGFKLVRIGEFGLTMKERYGLRNSESDPLDDSILAEAKSSIIENISRPRGGYIRALFEL